MKTCILKHRGSELKEKLTIEETCVADADVISHFDIVLLLFYLAFYNRKLSLAHGVVFFKRSYNKLSQQSREIYKEKYDRVIITICQ